MIVMSGQVSAPAAAALATSAPSLRPRSFVFHCEEEGLCVCVCVCEGEGRDTGSTVAMFIECCAIASRVILGWNERRGGDRSGACREQRRGYEEGWARPCIMQMPINARVEWREED